MQIDALGRFWALASDLLQGYGFPMPGMQAYAASSSGPSLWLPLPCRCRAGFGGWPLVELTLQTDSAPIILTSILLPGPSGDRAWCKVLEFAEVWDLCQLRASGAG